MLKSDVYKPYPFVFARGVKTKGLGLSGPGGVLFPSYPPVDSNYTSKKINNIPSSPILLSGAFSDEMGIIGEMVNVTFSYSINPFNLILSGIDTMFDSLADVFVTYSNANLYNIGEDIEEIEESLGDPIMCIVFAYNGNMEGIPGALAYSLNETLPFDILFSFSGAITPDTGIDNRTCNISFSRLICKLTLSGENDYQISNCEWITDYDADNDWSIVVSSGFTGNGSSYTPKLEININDIKVISHPEQMGYASMYVGGLLAKQSAIITLPVYVSDCESVIGPCWLPHTTFYPLVEVDKTPLSINLLNWIDMEGDDMSYSDLTPGYGIIQRTASELAPEKIVSNVGQLLNYPIRNNNLMYESFQPDCVDTRIIQDNSIYPVTGPFNMNQILEFFETHERVTRKF